MASSGLQAGSTSERQSVPRWINGIRKTLIWALFLSLLAIPGSCLMGRFDFLMLLAIWVLFVTPVIALISTTYLIVWLSTLRKYAYDYTRRSTILLVTSVTLALGATVWVLCLFASMGNLA